MPNPTPRRKSQPQRTGTYSTATQVQGAGSNQTRQYLADIAARRGNQQPLWDSVLTDMPGNQTYAQLKQAVASPQGAALLDAYARENRLPAPPTREQYLQAQFEAAQQRFFQRADANPAQNLFNGAADEAYRRQAGETFVNNTLAGAASTGMAPSPSELSRFYDKTKDEGALKVAPAMAARRVVAPAAPVMQPRRGVASR